MPQERDWWEKSEIIAKIVSAIVLPIVLLLINSTISNTEARRQKAESKAAVDRQKAESQAAVDRQKAESQANRLPVFIDFLSSESPKKVALATKVLPYLAKTNQIPNDVIPLLIEIDKAQTANEARNPDSARTALQALANANPGFRDAISKALTTDVFIQIANPSQLNMAEKAKARLRENGFRVPDIEVVSKATFPSEQVEIRYFDNDTSVQAKAVANILSAIGISSSTKIAPQYGKLKHLEIWFPRVLR